jgi:hypothetical protein
MPEHTSGSSHVAVPAGTPRASRTDTDGVEQLFICMLSSLASRGILYTTRQTPMEISKYNPDTN